MKPLLLSLLLAAGMVACGQTKVYGKVDSLIQYQDAQIISYKKNGKQVRDTVWNDSRKNIEIDWAKVVEVRSDYLRPRVKFTKPKP